eukprot:4641520-Pyramimonas_sp.AAC.1
MWSIIDQHRLSGYYVDVKGCRDVVEGFVLGVDSMACSEATRPGTTLRQFLDNSRQFRPCARLEPYAYRTLAVRASRLTYFPPYEPTLAIIEVRGAVCDTLCCQCWGALGQCRGALGQCRGAL